MGNEANKMPVDLERLIQDVLSELGGQGDPSVIAEKVRRLDFGLPAEDEFAVVCAWLGKCQLLHKLDQQQVPVSSKRQFQVPDLLARFSTQTNKSPVLIEVKSSMKKGLSFTPDYLRRLKNYAELMGMPLLIAWKFHSVWILFDVQHLSKAKSNFNITFEKGMSENLMGALAGDVAYQLGTRAGVHVRSRKDRLVNRVENTDGHTEEWEMMIDGVSFTDYEGTRLEQLDPNVEALFHTWDLTEQQEHTDSHIHLRYIVAKEEVQFAHKALVRMLHWEARDGARPHWRRLMREERILASLASFEAALDAGLEQKIVRLALHMRPRTPVEFVPRIEGEEGYVPLDAETAKQPTRELPLRC